MDSPSTARRALFRYSTQPEAVILPRRLSKKAKPAPLPPEIKLRAGINLGNAYQVLVVTDEFGAPLVRKRKFVRPSSLGARRRL